MAIDLFNSHNIFFENKSLFLYSYAHFKDVQCVVVISPLTCIFIIVIFLNVYEPSSKKDIDYIHFLPSSNIDLLSQIGVTVTAVGFFF